MFSPSGQTQYSATPDDDLFRQISKTYSENHPKMHLANPHEINCTRALKRFTDGISNGASWSPLTGGMQDYNYVRSNCYEVTVELGCEKFPREENLKTYWEENKKSLIKFIEFVSSFSNLIRIKVNSQVFKKPFLKFLFLQLC